MLVLKSDVYCEDLLCYYLALYDSQTVRLDIWFTCIVCTVLYNSVQYIVHIVLNSAMYIQCTTYCAMCTV